MSTRIADPRLPVPAEGLTDATCFPSPGETTASLATTGTGSRVHRRAMACRFEVTLSGERAPDDPRRARSARRGRTPRGRCCRSFARRARSARINQQRRRSARSRRATMLLRCSPAAGSCQPPLAAPSTSRPRRSAAAGASCGATAACPPTRRSTRRCALVGHGRTVAATPATRRVASSTPGAAVNLGAVGKGFAVQAIGAALCAPRRARSAGLRRRQQRSSRSAARTTAGRWT